MTVFMCITYYERQHYKMLQHARICYGNSARLSVRLSRAWIVSKRLNILAKFISLADRPITLVFRHQGLFRKSDGFTPNGGAGYKGVAIFDQYAVISRKR